MTTPTAQPRGLTWRRRYYLAVGVGLFTMILLAQFVQGWAPTLLGVLAGVLTFYALKAAAAPGAGKRDG